MWPAGFQGPRALGRRPLLRLLRLLLLLPLSPPPKPVTYAQTTPDSPSDQTMPGFPSTATTLRPPSAPSVPHLRERARALMRDFPLVDGCVSVWRLSTPLAVEGSRRLSG